MLLWEVHQQLRAMTGMSVYLIHGCPFISSCVLFIKLMSGLKTCFKFSTDLPLQDQPRALFVFSHCSLNTQPSWIALDYVPMSMSTTEHAADDATFIHRKGGPASMYKLNHHVHSRTKILFLHTMNLVHVLPFDEYPRQEPPSSVGG